MNTILAELKARTDRDRVTIGHDIVPRLDRDREKLRTAVNALAEHDNERHAAMVAVLDAVHLLTERVALLRAKLDLLTDVDERSRVH